MPILFALCALGCCGHADGQVNSWQNPASADWADPSNWSLGIRPGANQSVLITNSGWKAVALGPNAANRFPDSLDVQSILLSAPTDSFNVLLLNYAGYTPVVAGGITIRSNAAMTVLSSILLVTNTANTDVHRIEVGGTVNQGANATIDTSFLSLGNIGPGVYNLTNGSLHGTTEYIGGTFPGRFQQFGGHHSADLLRILYADQGRYELYGGTLSGNVELYSWGTLHQTGGIFNGTLLLGGSYILEDGLYTNLSLECGGTILQTGGTNTVGYLGVGADTGYGGGTYTLSNGVLNTSATSITLGWLVQQGGALTVNGQMTLRGDNVALKPFGEIVPGYYFLRGGRASMRGLDLQRYGEVYQEAGSNYVAGDIHIGDANTDHSSYLLSGGNLVSSNLTIAGSWGINCFQNHGGTHVVRGSLNINGLSAPYGSNYYELDGGQLTASEIRLTPYASFVHRRGAILGSPKLSIWQSTWAATPGVTHFGRLEGNAASLQFPAEPCTLTFSNCSGSTLGFTTIRGWNGSPSGGGQHQILFPRGGLSEQQITNIFFELPNGGADHGFFALWPATLLSTGELVPNQHVLRARRAGANLVLTWSFPVPLQTATNPAGPFTTITNAYSPYTNHFLEPQRFFRLNL